MENEDYTEEAGFTEVTVRFTDEVNALPLPYANAFNVQSGIDDFFVTVGSAVPPDVDSPEELKQYKEVLARPLFRFALSRSVMQEFVRVLRIQLADQI